MQQEAPEIVIVRNICAVMIFFMLRYLSRRAIVNASMAILLHYSCFKSDKNHITFYRGCKMNASFIAVVLH